MPYINEELNNYDEFKDTVTKKGRRIGFVIGTLMREYLKGRSVVK